MNHALRRASCSLWMKCSFASFSDTSRTRASLEENGGREGGREGREDGGEGGIGNREREEREGERMEERERMYMYMYM